MNFSLPKSNKLLSKEDFLHLKSDATVVSSKLFLFIFKKNNSAFSRLGLSFSRKVGNAVHRNYFKRVSREFFRTSDFKNLGFDLHIVGRASLKGASREMISDSLINFFSNAKSKLSK